MKPPSSRAWFRPVDEASEIANVSQVSGDQSPLGVLVLDDDERIRAYVHPTRMSLLGLLARQPMTATGVARALGVHPANLTRHLRLLEQTGLIRIVERRDTGRNLEKYYRATALAFEVRLATDRIEDRRATVLGILRDNLSTAVVTTSTSSSEVVGLLEQVRLDRRDISRLRERFDALVHEFAELDAPDGDPYTLSVALYPAPASAPEAPIGEVRP